MFNSVEGILGLAIGFAGLVYARMQTLEARKSEQKNDRNFNQIAGLLNSLKGPKEDGVVQGNSIIEARVLDINGDGRDELLVTYPVGAHGATMKVFASDSIKELHEIGSFFGDSGPYFKIEKSENLLPEIVTFTRNYNGDPVGDAPQTNRYKWAGESFSEISDMSSISNEKNL